MMSMMSEVARAYIRESKAEAMVRGSGAKLPEAESVLSFQASIGKLPNSIHIP